MIAERLSPTNWKVESLPLRMGSTHGTPTLERNTILAKQPVAKRERVTSPVLGCVIPPAIPSAPNPVRQRVPCAVATPVPPVVEIAVLVVLPSAIPVVRRSVRTSQDMPV